MIEVARSAQRVGRLLSQSSGRPKRFSALHKVLHRNTRRNFPRSKRKVLFIQAFLRTMM